MSAGESGAPKSPSARRLQGCRENTRPLQLPRPDRRPAWRRRGRRVRESPRRWGATTGRDTVLPPAGMLLAGGFIAALARSALMPWGLSTFETTDRREPGPRALSLDSSAGDGYVRSKPTENAAKRGSRPSSGRAVRTAVNVARSGSMSSPRRSDRDPPPLERTARESPGSAPTPAAKAAPGQPRRFRARPYPPAAAPRRCHRGPGRAAPARRRSSPSRLRSNLAPFQLLGF